MDTQYKRRVVIRMNFTDHETYHVQAEDALEEGAGEGYDKTMFTDQCDIEKSLLHIHACAVLIYHMRSYSPRNMLTFCYPTF